MTWRIDWIFKSTLKINCEHTTFRAVIWIISDLAIHIIYRKGEIERDTFLISAYERTTREGGGDETQHLLNTKSTDIHTLPYKHSILLQYIRNQHFFLLPEFFIGI